ncbi:hypothetical protein [Streptomyces sp.]|uniref:hypothetical protein n=1 Tax=Streptomyces sp. TaxID=1931 RepID=UPI00281279FF|nr:hypothetical protein [Streptomyces sp.]
MPSLDDPNRPPRLLYGGDRNPEQWPGDPGTVPPPGPHRDPLTGERAGTTVRPDRFGTAVQEATP